MSRGCKPKIDELDSMACHGKNNYIMIVIMIMIIIYVLRDELKMICK